MKFSKTNYPKALEESNHPDSIFKYRGRTYEINEPKDELDHDGWGKLLWWWDPEPWRLDPDQGIWRAMYRLTLAPEIVAACRIYQSMRPDMPAYEFLNRTLGN
jgi:hypothetical protein